MKIAFNYFLLNFYRQVDIFIAPNGEAIDKYTVKRPCSFENCLETLSFRPTGW